MFKAVIFDFDGVLVDTFDLNYKIYKHIGTELGIKIPPTKEKLVQLTDGNWRGLLTKLGIIEAERINKAVDIYQSAHFRMENDIHTFPEIPLVLSQLKEAGLKIGLVSNNHRLTIERVMRRLNIFKYFDSIVAIDGVSAMKPDPTQLNICLGEMGVHASEAVFVGDMEADMLAGRAANMAGVIGVSYGFHSKERLTKFKPDRIVDRPIELMEAVYPEAVSRK